MTSRKPPSGTRAAGRRLWTSVVDEFELDERELVVLVQATRTADLLDDLETEIRDGGAIVDSPQGRRANPAAVEARQQRVVLARLLAALRLPEDAADPAGRPARRGGVRAPYKLRGVS